MTKEINLTILLHDPVNGVVYGLQKGKSPNCETVQAQTGKGQDLSFSFTIQLKQAAAKGITPGGSFVQGPAGSRFVYIAIGSYGGQVGAHWSGRLKIPLPEADFQNAFADENANNWYCTVPGSKDGKPVYATVKPFSGWLLQKPSDKNGEEKKL
ncbi:hypothetical protein HRG84_05780 [Flavisolibacter sp. BT320]|nr:hypothetical protein [Flavisolibacter longurius]